MTTLCPNCQLSLAVRFAAVTDPETLETFSILACKECGLGRTDPIPADLSPYYGPTYHGERHGTTAGLCARRRVRRLLACTGGATGRLLDVGCGDGTFLLAARARGFAIAGTEMNPVRAQAAGIDVVTEVAGAARFGPFDAITLWHVFEHLRNPALTLRTLFDLLAPGGRLILAVPRFDSAQARSTGRHWLHLDVPRHLWHFSELSLRRMLEASGFVVERRYGHEWEYDLFGWAQSWLNAALPEKNRFFRLITKKSGPISAFAKAGHFALGSAACGLALPLVGMEVLSGRGGTLVLCARKADPPPR